MASGWDWISLGSCLLGAVVSAAICRWRYRGILERTEASRDFWRNEARARGVRDVESQTDGVRIARLVIDGTTVLCLLAALSGCAGVRVRCHGDNRQPIYCSVETER